MEKMKRVKGLLAAAVAAAGLVAFAEPVVEITKAWQANPGSGVVDFTYEVRDLDGASCDLVVRVEAKGCNQTYTFTNENVSAGSTTTNVDYKTKLGMVSPNVSIYASLVQCQMRGVQLWEGGPYWATYNVGATKPEETGYYFWWGDTVGATQKVDKTGWVSVKDGSTTIMFSNSNPASSTFGKSAEWLYDKGYIDDNSADGKLTPKYDAATVSLGAPWRMPTGSEMSDLSSKCNSTWTNNWNGTEVNGVLVTGKGDYAMNSIFLPAVGFGMDGSLADSPSAYWASQPAFADPSTARKISFSNSGWLDVTTSNNRYFGFAVRAVRDVK